LQQCSSDNCRFRSDCICRFSTETEYTGKDFRNSNNGGASGADGKYTVSDIPEGSDYYVFAFDSSGKYVSEWWNRAGRSCV